MICCAIAAVYTFYLAIKIILMPTAAYNTTHRQLHDEWVTTKDGTLLIKKRGVGIKRKLKAKENDLKINKLDY